MVLIADKTTNTQIPQIHNTHDTNINQENLDNHDLPCHLQLTLAWLLIGKVNISTNTEMK